MFEVIEIFKNQAIFAVNSIRGSNDGAEIKRQTLHVISVFLLSCHTGLTLASGESSPSSIPPTHDLQDIKKTAETFLRVDNERHQTAFIATDPNPKITVERCSVPLKSEWAHQSYGLSKKSVRVICQTTPHDKKGWHVFVPVLSP